MIPGERSRGGLGIVTTALLDLLDRLVPLAASVARGVRALALVGAAAVLLIAVVVLLRWLPDATEGRLAVALLLALLAVPPGILFVFVFLLREVLEIPERLRGYPDLSRDRAAELGAVVREAGERQRPAWRRLPASTWRLAALVRSSRDLLAPHAPILPLLSVPFLFATVAAALAVPLLVLAALVVLLAAVV